MTPIIGTIASSITGNLIPTSGYISLASHTVTSTSSATVTFNNIPQIYSHLEIRSNYGENVTNNNEFLVMYFNGDQTSTNYVSARSQRNRYTVSGGGASSQSFTLYDTFGWIFIGSTTQDNPDSDLKFLASAITKIPDYANTSKFKSTTSWGYHQTSDNDYYLNRGWGTWSSTAAITSISLRPSGSFSWVTGTTFSLYGVK